jgi:hypothetical protein
MIPSLYKFLHLSGLFLLAGYTFYALVAPAEHRKRVMIITGVASLIVLVSGFALLHSAYADHFYLWVVVKLGCWLGLSALAGLAFRRREQMGLWNLLVLVFIFVALAMVCFKPGM